MMRSGRKPQHSQNARCGDDMLDRTDSAGSSSGNRWRCRVHRNESGAAPRAKQMGADNWQAMPATGSHWAADITATTTEAEMSETIGGDWPLIISPVAMPVCLRGDRLEFQSCCHVHSELMDIVGLDWSETEGESYDGASIPRLAWSIVGHPLQQEFRWPSYWHDRLCENSRTWSERRLADAVLLVLLEKEKVAYWRRTAMWIAVWLYAWLWWSWRRWFR